jgi:hypothetical protein
MLTHHRLVARQWPVLADGVVAADASTSPTICIARRRAAALRA